MKLDYTTPTLEICLLTVEQGFQGSVAKAETPNYTTGTDQTYDN
ncbi:MAG: hypothetical protein RR330_07290 [Alistipes sp.]